MYNTELPTRAELPTSRQLIRSTVIAVVTAGVLLTTTVLPAEYGIDPTGIGNALGLKKMGEIKTTLAREAAAEAQGSPPPADAAPSTTISTATAAPKTEAAASPAPTLEPAGKSDEVTVSLKPGQAAEVKLDMRKGAKVSYEWTVRGGAVNVDAHGDPVNPPAGFYHGYGKGRQMSKDAGVLQAAFDGKHGWYWRNRSISAVTLTLNTTGQYTAIKRVL
jgi:hypothetical protein